MAEVRNKPGRLVRRVVHALGLQRAETTYRKSAGGTDLVVDIAVNAAVVQGLRTQIFGMRKMPPYDAMPDEYEELAERMIVRAAPALALALKAVRAGKHNPHLTVVRGLQVVADPIWTPLNGRFDQTGAAVETAVLVGCIRLLGFSGVAFANENKGKLFRAVCPVPETGHLPNSQGAGELAWHSDNALNRVAHSNDPHPVDYPVANVLQAFATLTPDEKVPMQVKSALDILAWIDTRGDQGAVEDLKRPNYRFSSPQSYDSPVMVSRIPVLVTLDQPSQGVGMRYRGDVMSALDERGRVALEKLNFAISQSPHQTIRTQRGDLVIYDNRRTLHRREAFQPRFDGKDRYYVRLYCNPTPDVMARRHDAGGNGRVM